jgi:hypothetical protein
MAAALFAAAVPVTDASGFPNLQNPLWCRSASGERNK